MAQLFPYINFGGKCAEALEFYKAALGGEYDMMKIGDTPMKDQMGPEGNNKVMHAYFHAPGVVIGASDMADKFTPTHDFSLCLDCKDEAEFDDLWAKLSEGATIDHPKDKTFWGVFGDFTDKFGVHWMFNFTPPENKKEGK